MSLFLTESPASPAVLLDVARATFKRTPPGAARATMGWEWRTLAALPLPTALRRVPRATCKRTLRRAVRGARVWGWLALTVLIRAAQPGASPPAVPLLRAHAHNDYEHARPLLDALDHGFCSVEADIYLVDGRLLVAHDRAQTRPDRTLETLYLDPLRARVRTHAGAVHPAAGRFILLIDLKSDGANTYAVLHQTLARYAEMLTMFDRGAVRTNAVTVILSGNRPRAQMLAELVRYAFFDGRLADLEAEAPPGFMPLVSDNWSLHFRWRGDGWLAEDERTRLQRVVEQAHRRDCLVRFWGAPDRPAGWQLLLDAGVDLINTDDLEGLRRFLLAPARASARTEP